jgi:hypothetical protein
MVQLPLVLSQLLAPEALQNVLWPRPAGLAPQLVLIKTIPIPTPATAVVQHLPIQAASSLLAVVPVGMLPPLGNASTTLAALMSLPGQPHLLNPLPPAGPT